MNRTVLLSGASGFVGARVASDLAGLGFGVTALGGKNSCPASVAAKAVRCVNADLTLPGAADSMLSETRPGIVIHAAALANSTACEQNPERAQSANVEATRLLIQSCRNSASSPLFVFISTDLVFDGAVAPPGGFKESAIPQPRSVYAQSKLAAEQLVSNSGLPAVIVRLSLVYGEKIENMWGFMGWLIKGLAAKEKRGCFFDEVRTPIYAGDVGQAIGRVIESADDKPGCRIINIAGDEMISRLDFGRLTCEVFGFDPTLVVSESRLDVASAVIRPADVSLDITRLKNELSYHPLGVREGLQQMKARSI